MKRLHIMLGLLTLPILASATSPPAGGPPLVSFEFVDDRGHTLATFPTGSEEADVYRAYLEAMPEANYSIRATNLTNKRLGVVIAVDGRNIISGERSELAPSESMYVLEPHRSATYSGWRTSQNEVHRFVFTNVRNSYASRIGDESAIGVIAAAIFEPRTPPAEIRRQRSSGRNSAPAPSAASADRAEEASDQAGTGFGDSQYSRAVRVSFSPRSAPSARTFFKYEWADQLCARGIKACESSNRFWPYSRNGFVPYPPQAN